MGLIVETIRQGAVGDLEDGKKRIITGILSKKIKESRNNFTSYYWYISDKKYVLHRSYDTYDNADLGDLLEIQITHFCGSMLKIKKIDAKYLELLEPTIYWSEIE